jgi:hypothetical protein
MWVRHLRWHIFGASLVLLMAVLWAAYRLTAVSAPTALTIPPTNLARLQLPPLPPALASIITSAGDDAGPHYRQATDAYLAKRSTYDPILRGRKLPPEQVRQLPVLLLLLHAAPCRQMHLFAARPEQVVRYRPAEAVAPIETVGRIAIAAALSLAKSDPQQARRYYEAAFALGAKLCEERLIYEELTAGLGLMTASAQGLLKLDQSAGNQQSADATAAYIQSCLNYDRDRIKPIIAAIRTIDPAQMDRHAGDVFVFASDSQERLWRVEATLQLGRIRFGVARRADQRGAAALAAKLAADTDPAVRAAACAARDLTLGDYRMQGAP